LCARRATRADDRGRASACVMAQPPARRQRRNRVKRSAEADRRKIPCRPGTEYPVLRSDCIRSAVPPTALRVEGRRSGACRPPAVFLSGPKSGATPPWSNGRSGRMRIGIAGINGRMGRLLAEEVVQAGADLVGGVDAGGAPGDARLFPDIRALAQACDLVMEFTHASAAQGHAAALAEAGVAWVLGTSGLSAADEAAVRAASARITARRSTRRPAPPSRWAAPWRQGGAWSSRRSPSGGATAIPGRGPRARSAS